MGPNDYMGIPLTLRTFYGGSFLPNILNLNMLSAALENRSFFLILPGMAVSPCNVGSSFCSQNSLFPMMDEH